MRPLPGQHPALHPHRFDRELLFPLPDVTARASILRIHTRRWAAPPREELLGELAAAAVGYCGADLKVGHCGALGVLCGASSARNSSPNNLN